MVCSASWFAPRSEAASPTPGIACTQQAIAHAAPGCAPRHLVWSAPLQPWQGCAAVARATRLRSISSSTRAGTLHVNYVLRVYRVHVTRVRAPRSAAGGVAADAAGVAPGHHQALELVVLVDLAAWLPTLLSYWTTLAVRPACLGARASLGCLKRGEPGAFDAHLASSQPFSALA